MEDKLYDITPIPVFPWVPGAALWLALVVVLGAALSLWWLRAYLPQIFSRRRGVFRALCREIESMRDGSGRLSREALSRLSLLIRRYLAFSLGQSVLSFTGTELTGLAGSSAAPLSSILLRLASIEEMRYRAGEPGEMAPLLRNFLTDLAQYEQLRVKEFRR